MKLHGVVLKFSGILKKYILVKIRQKMDFMKQGSRERN